IIEQQAQFALNIQRLQEEQFRERPCLSRLEDSFQLLVQLVEATDARLDATDTRLDASDTRVDTLESNMVKLEANMAALAEAQAHSDARLSALIDIVRDGRNGRS
ncbi:MAG: hypothetical protein ACRD6N_10390, partial [Pyrinomonadaceae bacterium]